MNTRHGACRVSMLGLMAFLAGCEFDREKVPDYGAVRLENQSGETVYLYLNDELRLTLDPGKQGKRTVEDHSLQRISVRDASGRELFAQVVEIPRNTFAAYVVREDGSVAATAGNIRRPDVVGGGDHFIRVENGASFPVQLLLNGAPAATVSPYQASSIDVVDVDLRVTLRRSGGGVLFEQTLNLPENTTIVYQVLADGSVVTTGGPTEENTDIDRPEPTATYPF